MIPSPADTALLRACVLDGLHAAAAWRDWRARVAPGGSPAIIEPLASRGAFLPLLYWNLTRNGVAFEDPLTTFLRAAMVTEEVRWVRYRRLCGSALDILHGARIPYILLKGAAFGEHYFPSPLLRHTSDVDLLLRESDLERASRQFVDHGWTQKEATSLLERHHRHLPRLEHASGVPLELHRRFASFFYRVPYDELWTRSVSVEIAGREARMLAPADSLLHVVLHAACSAPGLRWIVDACFIIGRCPRLDWTTFVETALAARASLPAYTALRFLADEMSAQIPDRVLSDLGHAAAASGFLARQMARPLPSGTPREIWSDAETPWRGIAGLFARAFPSPIALALQFDIPIWQIPIEYAHRTVRGARYLMSGGITRP